MSATVAYNTTMPATQSFRLECIPMPPSCYYSMESEEQQRFSEIENGDNGTREKDDSLSSLSHSVASSERKIDLTRTVNDIEDERDVVEITDSRNSTESIDNDPRAKMMEEVLKELRCTDNILVSEIGRNDMISFLRYLLVFDANRTGGGDLTVDQATCHCKCDHWDFLDDGAFFYLMEIVQANTIYFLKHRYFEQKRGRFYPKSISDLDENTSHEDRSSCWTELSVLHDFQSVFTKAACSRYFPDKRRIVEYCFQDDAIDEISNTLPRNQLESRKASSGSMVPISRKIRRALVRLHRRAGIFLPHTKPTLRHHEYWVALWWVCSSLLVWSLDPCLEITRLVDDKFCRCGLESTQNHICSTAQSDSSIKPPPKQKRRLTNGYVQHSQSYIAKLPLGLIQQEIKKVALPFDRVLMHDGPWTTGDEEDDDFHLRQDCSMTEEYLEEDEEEVGDKDDIEGKHITVIGDVEVPKSVEVEAIVDLEQFGSSLRSCNEEQTEESNCDYNNLGSNDEEEMNDTSFWFREDAIGEIGHV